MADPTSIDTITNLGGTGAIVGLFIYYLKSRDAVMSEFSKAIYNMAEKFETLAHAIGALERRLNDIETRQQRRRRRRKDE